MAIVTLEELIKSRLAETWTKREELLKLKLWDIGRAQIQMAFQTTLKILHFTWITMRGHRLFLSGWITRKTLKLISIANNIWDSQKQRD